jgi:hypothetical protein
MIAIVSNRRLVAEYRQLLVSEWGDDFVDRTMALLWQTLAPGPQEGGEDGLRQILDPGNRTAWPTERFGRFFRVVADGARFLRLAKMPELPAESNPPRVITAEARLACRLAAYLTLEAHARIEGDVAFLGDLQALAFQAAIHTALPAIRRKHRAEHAVLLHSAALYALGLSTQDPAHSFYLMSVLHGYLRDEDGRLQALYASFRFTSPDDHSYLTKAQEYWSELLDARKYREAEQFLLRLSWWSLPSQEEEVGEMLREGMKVILKHEGRVPAV